MSKSIDVAFDALAAQEKAEVETFVSVIQTSTSERAVWREIMRSLAGDFRKAEWAEAADSLEHITDLTIELLDDIDKAKAAREPEPVQ